MPFPRSFATTPVKKVTTREARSLRAKAIVMPTVVSLRRTTRTCQGSENARAPSLIMWRLAAGEAIGR
jgi:hypothetical protein